MTQEKEGKNLVDNFYNYSVTAVYEYDAADVGETSHYILQIAKEYVHKFKHNN